MSKQFICFYPNVLVEFIEKTEKVFDRPLTVFEGRIEFNSDIIKYKMDKIIDEYKILFSVPEPNKTEQKKNAKKSVSQPHKQYRYKRKDK